MQKIISVFNQAGGVGKTTVCHNLGYHLSELGYRTLLVDLDPQASLTAFTGGSDLEWSPNFESAIVSDKDELFPEDIPILKGLNGLDLVPASLSLCTVEAFLPTMDYKEQALMKVLEPLQDSYDFIILDCPPSLAQLSAIALHASTHILIPIQTQYKALKGTDLVLSTIKRVTKRGNRRLKVEGFVPTLFDSRRGLDRDCLESITSQLNRMGPVFSPIPNSTAIAEAPAHHKPLGLYRPKHPATQVFRTIAEQISGHVTCKVENG